MARFGPTLAVVVSVLLGSSTLLACAHIAEDQALMFEVSQRRYTQLIRFTDYERAGRYVAPDDRVGFRARTEALGDLRFTDYEVREVENLGNTATAQVAYIGYRASDPIVVTYVEDQEWENDGGAWVVRSHIEEHTP